MAEGDTAVRVLTYEFMMGLGATMGATEDMEDANEAVVMGAVDSPGMEDIVEEMGKAADDVESVDEADAVAREDEEAQEGAAEVMKESAGIVMFLGMGLRGMGSTGVWA